MTYRVVHPERPRRCTEITSKQASGSSEQASGSSEQASGSGEQASGSGGQASGSEESGDPKPTLQDPHRGRRPSRDCRGGFHSSVER